MNPDTVKLIVVLSVIVLPCIALLAMVYYQHQSANNTQRHLTDRDLLRMIATEPDQLISPHQLSDKTELSLNEARARLNALFSYGILRRSFNRRGRHFFGTRAPVEEPPAMNLSADPFLTVEDLLQIFEAYDYRVTAQQMIMATGLPLNVIKREMKYFEDQQMTQRLQRSDVNGMTTARFYVLQDPYRSDPDRFRAKAGQLDLEMRKILVNEKLLV